MAIDPMQFFDIGRQAGAANSPVGSTSDMLRGILANAQKRGLLQAQSQGNMALAKYKATLDQPVMHTPEEFGITDTSKPTVIHDPQSKQDILRTPRYDDKGRLIGYADKNVRGMSIEDVIAQQMADGGMGTGSGSMAGDSAGNYQSFTSAEEALAAKSSGLIKTGDKILVNGQLIDVD